MTVAELKTELYSALMPIVRKSVQTYLDSLPIWERAWLSAIQEVAGAAVAAVRRCVYDAWKEELEALSELLGKLCATCGQQRQCRWRWHTPMKLAVTGEQVEVPNLYLECRRCKGPGVSIIKLLTGLRSGDASEEQKLLAAYAAAGHSYREASEVLKVHHGRSIEGMKVRRMALEIEKSAMEYAETSRVATLNRLEQEGEMESGPEFLVLQADGGTVRTGRLQPLEPDEPGYGKLTPKRQKPRRKRPAEFREVITFDVREPGESEASALDLMVPVQSEKNERSRRMLALAGRKGMGKDTEVVGLGDMGSGLADAFQEAFEIYNPSSRWHADWKHTQDYVHAAAKALVKLDAEKWERDMRQAIWDRDETRRDELLEQAGTHRKGGIKPDETQSTGTDKCPVERMTTYLGNNWNHMHYAALRDRDLPFVSARAEAQVRDRTKRRFSGPGVWRVENLEPKATLRALIAEGRWDAFCTYHLDKTRDQFHQSLRERLTEAVAQGRIRKEVVPTILSSSISTAALTTRVTP